MKKKLVIIGGFINLFFLIFHIYLGFSIANFQNLLPDHKILMQMLNVGGIGFMAFFTYVSFFCIKELIETKLGKVVFLIIFLTYFVRAFEEFLFFGQHLSLPILLSCFLVSLMYLYILVYKER